MKKLSIILTTCLLFASCSHEERKNRVFENLTEQDTVVIYLSTYDLDSVPKEIGTLRNAKGIFIFSDSTNGWTIYPPLIALQQRTDRPPFRTLPDEITTLTNLTWLGLMDLKLRELPKDFDKLENLDSLNLFMNKLTIANEIEKLEKLKKLRYLGLFGNKVDSTDIQRLKDSNPDLKIDAGLE